MPKKEREKRPSLADIRKARMRFARSSTAESRYERELSAAARQIGQIIRGLAPNGIIADFPALRDSLERYSEALGPWARAVSEGMHARVAKRDVLSWVELSREMGRELRQQIQRAPVGRAMRMALSEQVVLIKSLPREAAERVHRLTTEAITAGTRADEVAREILRSGEVTVSRARLIARTEVARTASLLVQSRSEHVGSTHYIWRTVMDGRVRKTHKHLEGKVISWDFPPVAEASGLRYHAGQGPNCRCFAEPIIPREVKQ